MKIDRRTMLKVSGGLALGLIVPKVKAETRKPVAYIVTEDSQPFYSNGRLAINRSWHVYWTKHPELQERLDPHRYRYSNNVKIEAFYDTEDFPWPALHPLKLYAPLCVPLTEYNEYHCFRTYDVNCGRIHVIYDKDGRIA